MVSGTHEGVYEYVGVDGVLPHVRDAGVKGVLAPEDLLGRGDSVDPVVADAFLRLVPEQKFELATGV